MQCIMCSQRQRAKGEDDVLLLGKVVSAHVYLLNR